VEWKPQEADKDKADAEDAAPGQAAVQPHVIGWHKGGMSG
jgi:hypothetical protein